MTKSFTTKNRSDLDHYIKLLRSERRIQEDGTIEFIGSRMFDASSVFGTFLSADRGIDYLRAERIVSKALFSSSLPIEFDLGDLLNECEALLQIQNKSKRKKYFVLSSFSSAEGIEFSDLKLDDVEIEFAVSDRDWALHTNTIESQYPELAKIADHSNARYLASIDAVDEHQAFRAIRRAMDMFRGAINLGTNMRMFRRNSAVRVSEPVNLFRNDKYLSIHAKGEEALSDPLYFFRDWVQPQSVLVPTQLVSMQNQLNNRFIGYLNERGTFNEFAKEGLVRYCRAMDTVDWQYSFLELWSVLEYLCCIQPGQEHRKVVDRASRLYRDTKEARACLDHLRRRRNSMVHGNYEGAASTTEQLLYQLNGYVSQTLWLAIGNKMQFASTQDWIEFLDLKGSVDQLKSRIGTLEKAIRYMSGDP
ncbi:MAG: hypothetical protein Hens2KO_31210 [Henriciella sp.]